MKTASTIRNVEAIPVSYREPTDHDRFRSVCLVRILGHDGHVGWGECCTFFPEATRAAAAIVEGLAEIVAGQCALQNEAIWHRLKEHCWWYGTDTGIASMAIAGIDIALWDLKGKILGARVLDLLGGPVRERLPAIASLHGTKPSIEEMAEEIAAHTATGLHGAKVGFGKRGEANLGFDLHRDIEFVRRVTEVMGPGKDLMIDLGVKNFWDVPTAIRRGPGLRGVRSRLAGGAARARRPGRICRAARRDRHSHCVWRARMERPGRQADCRHGAPSTWSGLDAGPRGGE